MEADTETEKLLIFTVTLLKKIPTVQKNETYCYSNI